MGMGSMVGLWEWDLLGKHGGIMGMGPIGETWWDYGNGTYWYGNGLWHCADLLLPGVTAEVWHSVRDKSPSLSS